MKQDKISSAPQQPIHGPHSFGMSELLHFRTIAPDDVQQEFDSLLAEGKDSEAKMILMKYLGEHLKFASENIDPVEFGEQDLRALAKEKGYRLSHALKESPYKKTYFFDKEVERDLIDPFSSKLVLLPANFEISLNYTGNSLSLSVRDMNIGKTSAEKMPAPLDLQKEYDTIKSLIDQLEQMNTKIKESEKQLPTEEYQKFETDFDSIKLALSRQNITLEELNTIRTSAEELVSLGKKLEDQIKNSSTVTLNSGTNVYDFKSEKMLAYPETEQVSIVREYKGDKREYYVIQNKNNEQYLVAKTDIIKQSSKKIDKESLYAPREYPEWGETSIDHPHMLETPFDRYSPGTGESYLSFPNVGDVMTDRTNTRGHAGDAEYKDKAECNNCKHNFEYTKEPEAGMGYVECPNCKQPVTQQELIVKDEKTLIREEYEKMLQEAVDSRAPRELIKYYREILEKGN